jgi:hypothetical protein
MGGLVRTTKSTERKVDELCSNSVVARQDPQNQIRNFDCCFAVVTRAVENVETDGMTDHDFRVEYSGLILALADVFYFTLDKRSPMDSAELISDVLNVSVEFSFIPRHWSSVSVRTLLLACVRLRARQWTCVMRDLEYPDAQVHQDIRHSNYLSVPCYFSFVSHLHRVWEDRHYGGGLPLQRIIEHFIGKFGEDLECYDITEEIVYVYGAKAPSVRRSGEIRRAANQSSIDDFFHTTPSDDAVSDYTQIPGEVDHLVDNRDRKRFCSSFE